MFYHTATAIIKWNSNLGFYPTGRHSLLLFTDLFFALELPDPKIPAPFRSPSSSYGFHQFMRVKRSVDFRMAPKKATKGKGAAAEPTRDEEWNTSKCSQFDLESLVS